MKFILMILLALPIAPVFSQDMLVKISAGNESINISLDDDNDDKLITIRTPSAANYLTITIINEEIDKDWKRSFYIYDRDDNAVKDFVLMKDSSYCIKIKDLIQVLEPGSNYFIYTTAVPKDPQEAMLVKVARTLLCKIKLGN